MAGEGIQRKLASRLCRYPCMTKVTLTCSISEINTFYTVIQDGHQKWQEHEFGEKSTVELDLRIGEPMQICIHRKNNSPKPVNHRLTLKEGPKVNFNIRRFQA